MELGDRVRVPLVEFAIPPPLVEAPGWQVTFSGYLFTGKSSTVALQRLGFQGVQADAADPGRGPGEILVDQLLAQPDRLKYLGAAIALNRGDAHLGHDLENALLISFDEVFLGVVWLGAVQFSGFGHLANRFQGQVGIDGAGPIADQKGKVMHFPGVSRLHDKTRFGSGPFPDQMVVYRGGCQHTGDGRPTGVHTPVGENDDAVAVDDGLGSLSAQVVQSRLHRARHALSIEQCGQRDRPQVTYVQVTDFFELVASDDWRMELQLVAMRRCLFEKVLLPSDERFQGGNQVFTDRVQRRVGDLGE